MKPNNLQVGIFTNDYDVVKTIIEIQQRKYKNDIEYIRKDKTTLNLRLKDGTNFIWLKPNNNIRGYRCSKAYVDLSIDFTLIQDIIKSICVYCDKEDYEIFDIKANNLFQYYDLETLIDRLQKIYYLCGNMPIATDKEAYVQPSEDIDFGDIEYFDSERDKWINKRG